MFEEGQKVHYHPLKDDFVQRSENGIVKRVSGNSVWVVYYCNDDWENYQNYTGQLTPLEYLKEGWVDHSSIN